MNVSMNPSKPLAVSVLAGWIVMLIVYGCTFFLSPNPGPEMDPYATFIIFGAILSVFYFADVILITIPCFLFQKWLGRIRAWQRASYGGVLFGLSAPVWELVCSNRDAGEFYYSAALGFITGFISFLVLVPL